MSRYGMLATLTRGLTLASLLVLAGCGGGGGGGGSSSGGGPTLTSVTVSPATATVAAGLSQQFAAKANYSDGSNTDVTSSAAWSTSASGTATVGASTGKATGVAAGSATITATYQGKSGTATLTVTAATVQKVTVSPATASVAAGLTQAFTAQATLSDGTTQNVTADVTWSSSSTANATISNTGVATAVAQGSATITATCSVANVCANDSGTAALTVTAAAVTAIAIAPGPGITSQPASLTLPVTTTQQFYAIGTYSNGSTGDVTSQVTWSSDTTSVASFGSTAGLASAVGLGSTNVKATLGAVQATLPVSVINLGYVYAANYGDPSISPFAIGALGKLALNNGSNSGLLPAGTHQSLTGMAASPDGRCLYVVNSAEATVYAYSISSNGTIAAAGSTHAGLSTPVAVVVNSNSSAIYVSDYNSATTGAMVVGIPTSACGVFQAPVTNNFAAGTQAASALAIDAPGGWLYGVDVSNSGELFAAQIGSGGAIGTPSFATSIGNLPKSVAVDPTGQYVYVANYADNQIVGYQVDHTPSGTFYTALGGSPWTNGNSPVSVAVDASGQYVYVANDGSGSVSEWVIGDGSIGHPPAGGLGPLVPTTVPTGSGPYALVAEPSGGFAYVVNATDNTVSQYSIGATAAGVLTSLGTPLPATGSNPSAITAVASVPLVSIAVTPASVTMLSTDHPTLKVVGTYANGATRDLSAVAAWTWSSPPVVSVARGGRISANGGGAATVRAYFGSFASAPVAIQVQ